MKLVNVSLITLTLLEKTPEDQLLTAKKMSLKLEQLEKGKRKTTFVCMSMTCIQNMLIIVTFREKQHQTTTTTTTKS